MRRTTLLPALLLLAHDPRSRRPGHPEEAGDRHVLRDRGPRRLPLARGLERRAGAGLEPGAERRSPPRPRCAAAPRRDPAARGADREVSLSGVRGPRSRGARRCSPSRTSRRNSSPSSSRSHPSTTPRPSASSSTRTRSTPKGTTAIDFFVPSLDGRLVAVSLSEGGSEAGGVRVYDVGLGPGAAGRRAARQRRHGRAATSPGTPTARASSTRAIRGQGERAAGRHGLLPAGLLPQARHRRRDATPT